MSLSAFSVRSKLIAVQIERINRLLASRCYTRKDIARRFGVSEATIGKIDRGIKTI